MKVVRTKNTTLIVLENEEEEFKMEAVCAHFEKPDLGEDVTVACQIELQEFADNIVSELDYTEFGKI